MSNPSNEYDFLPTEETLSDPFGKVRHDLGSNKHAHSGRWGHFCYEWDLLWICEDCQEFDACLCWGKYKAEDFDESNCGGE